MKFDARAGTTTHTGQPITWINPFSMKKFYDKANLNPGLTRGVTSYDLTFNPSDNETPRINTARKSTARGSPHRIPQSRGQSRGQSRAQRSSTFSKLSFKDISMEPEFKPHRSLTEFSFKNPVTTPLFEHPLDSQPEDDFLQHQDELPLTEDLAPLEKDFATLATDVAPLGSASPKQATPPSSGGRKSQRPAGKTCCDYEISNIRCFNCQKKEQQNIWKSLDQERKIKEEEDAKKFLEFQIEMDKKSIERDKEAAKEQRSATQKIAAFNLEESMKAKLNKHEEAPVVPKSSYVLNHRPKTPPRQVKQELYYRDLADQINKRESAKKKERENTFLRESREQTKLAEDLAAERKQRYQDKNDHQEDYRRALSAQVKLRPLGLPEFVPDSDKQYFGQPDLVDKLEAAQKRQTKKMFQDQERLLKDRQLKAEQERLKKLREDDEQMSKNKDDLQRDRADRYDVIIQNRRDLEDSWRRAVDDKKRRDQEELEHIRKPAEPLHEQCHKYPRCGQCKRHTKNWGESNIWRETRYIPGSKIMV